MTKALMTLYRLAYYSRNRIPGGVPEIAAEVNAILAVAQHFNAKSNITGALVFNAGVFAQIIEGARTDVEQLFEKVKMDRRHGKVQLLALEKISKRGFPAWSMGFLGRSSEGNQSFGKIGDLTGFDAERFDGERLLDVLRAVALEREVRDHSNVPTGQKRELSLRWDVAQDRNDACTEQTAASHT